MDQIFVQLAILLFMAFVVSYIVRALKQPIIIGYILAGILISPFIVKYGLSNNVIDIFSQFGIAFLLFIVGLHLNPKIIKEIGTASLVVGIAQMAFTFAFGFLVSYLLLGFGTIVSVYIGVALAFSSTIIVMKILSDKHQLDSLFGKVSIGILIIQDLAAIIFLMFISSMNENVSIQGFAVKGVLFGGGLIIALFLIGFFVLPRLMKSIARSQELLFLFSITWCFLVAALFSYAGFSLEIGALIAGIVLSLSPYSVEISSKIRPLRDFFLVIFFIILGLNISGTNLDSVILNAVILSVVALVLKPIIIMFFMALFGYTNRTNFLVGISLAQISEFSLIILALGVSVGHIPPEILHTITLAGIITITISTYMLIYSQKFYKFMFKFASIFEKKSVKKERKIGKDYDAILFGYNRIGFSILKSFKELKKKFLVVDFNPDTIANLQKLRVPALYGDAYDSDLLADLPLNQASIIVSSIPDTETNILLIESIRAVNSKAVIIVRAHAIEEALDFYKKGATYVLTPHFLGGEYVADMLRNLKSNDIGYKNEREKHISMLMERLKEGHQHPDVEKN